MAYFAELNSANIVIRVLAVDDKDTANSEGVEQESIGQSFMTNLLGGTWKQTSFNRKIRGNFATKEGSYLPDEDLFMPPKPYNSWVVSTADATWIAPLAMPTDGNLYDWDEDNQSWINLNGASAGG